MTKYQSVYRTILLPALMTCAGIANEAAATTPAYTVIDLGTPGGTYSAGYGINASGQVTGNASPTGESHAFLWTPATPNGASGAMNDQGTLGGTYSTGSSINASGQVTGWSYTAGNFFITHAFLYDGTMHDLGTLGGSYSEGHGINDGGQVTGYSYTTGNADNRAFLYDGTMHDLGTLGGSGSIGNGINASGQVTGWSGTTGSVAIHAFLYDGTMHDLGTLGGSFSQGNGINAGGLVTGSSTTGDADTRAFLYDGSMHDLGTLGGTFAEGLGINAGGQVTGSSSTTGDIVSHAFLYTSGAGMVDLNSLIDPLSGWELFSAPGINDAGQIVGYGAIGGYAHAFLLNPVPEPTTLTLFLMGCAIAGARRRRTTSLHRISARS